ncbi:methyltransferase [Candidatus Bathyarchaeota archaeon]|nr:methyltransferase [Candidatus Bathyarchaeota archaeon]
MKTLKRIHLIIIRLLLLLWHKIHFKPIKIKILGRKFIVIPGVFLPYGVVTSKFLAKRLNVKKGDNVLDLGTGSGIQAVFAAEKAGKVVAIDINPKSVICAKINAQLNNFEGKIEVRKGDLFTPVKNEKFNLIIFNLPYLPFKSESFLEKAWCSGEKNELIKHFLREAGSFLVERGKLQLVYSSIAGDLNKLIKMLEELGFNAKISAYKILPFEKIVLINAVKRRIK